MGNSVVTDQSPVQERLLFIPSVINDDSFGWLDSPQGQGKQIPVLWFAVEAAVTTVLYFHGNSCDLGDMLEELQWLSKQSNVNVMAMEFPGYGVAQTDGTTPGELDHWARCCYFWLVKRGYHAHSIVLYGRSIGTGPAAKLASWCRQRGPKGYNKFGGLILVSPYKSIRSLAKDYAGLAQLLVHRHLWNTELHLHQIKDCTKTLIIHGVNDEVIPVAHSEALSAAMVGGDCTLELFPDRGHNDLAYVAMEPIQQFLGRVRTEAKATKMPETAN
ncbi:MAG: hypothetical protein KVP17_000052 [Porospora cf. gigantea B]|uniref:uncharacterized protein n=2 Tax=Porospora cf. gigantea B TaxID=2853592 RepID=UPI003571CD8C|nr:MAG: hypothetical protein KVP17_000052 [Porospora cf. gigantea B]